MPVWLDGWCPAGHPAPPPLLPSGSTPAEAPAAVLSPSCAKPCFGLYLTWRESQSSLEAWKALCRQVLTPLLCFHSLSQRGGLLAGAQVLRAHDCCKAFAPASPSSRGQGGGAYSRRAAEFARSVRSSLKCHPQGDTPPTSSLLSRFPEIPTPLFCFTFLQSSFPSHVLC